MIRGETQQVEILFDPNQAKYVQERRWHSTQRFKKLPDGRVRMTMEVSVSDDVLLWLLGHTETFEVVAPEALRDQVQDALKKAVTAHDKSPTKH